MKNVVATVARVPVYNAQGVRVAPLSERDVFMTAQRAAGATWTEAWKAWKAQAPQLRWPTQGELLEAADAQVE